MLQCNISEGFGAVWRGEVGHFLLVNIKKSMTEASHRPNIMKESNHCLIIKSLSAIEPEVISFYVRVGQIETDS